MPTLFKSAYVYNIKPTASGKTFLCEHKENVALGSEMMRVEIKETTIL